MAPTPHPRLLSSLRDREQEKQALCILRRLPLPARPWGPSLQGTTPRPEPPSSHALAQGVRGGGPSPVCMHLARSTSQETQPWGLMAVVLGHSGLCRGLAEATPAQRKKGPRQGRPPPSQSSHRSAAGSSHPALSPSWARAGRGPHLPASHSPHLYKFLVQPSKSRTQNGPRGSAATSTSRAALSPRVTPADTAPQACGRMHLLRPQQPHTFSAEALTRRHRLSPPRAASPGSSPAGRSGRNVSIDMYIPQCCTFVCSNHVNTCMDFIIYILYINL